MFAPALQRREQRRLDQLSNPHYLKPSSSPKATPKANEGTGLTSVASVDVSSIPIAKLELGSALIIGMYVCVCHVTVM